jgi:hypothetical protein
MLDKHSRWFMRHGSRRKAGMTISEAGRQSSKNDSAMSPVYGGYRPISLKNRNFSGQQGENSLYRGGAENAELGSDF